jgi:hypothetical protein
MMIAAENGPGCLSMNGAAHTFGLHFWRIRENFDIDMA